MKVLDLFSGIGGFGLAGRMVGGFDTVAFCEIDPFCRAVLAKHWPEVPIFDDVKTLTVELLRSSGIDDVDLITGGFPCQDISCAGKGAGIERGERSGLWREMFRLIKELLPRWVLGENVPALRTRGADIVIADLEAAGYAVWPVVVGAWAVGAPHKRDRAWIVARRVAHDEGGICNGEAGNLCGSKRGQGTGLSPISELAGIVADSHGIGCESLGISSLLDGQRASLGDDLDRRYGSVGAGVAEAEQMRRGPGPGIDGNEEGTGVRRDESARSGCMAIPASERPEESRGEHPGSQSPASASRWPAGLGAEQHAWEAPRVLRFERGVGAAVDGLPGTLVRHLRGFVRAKRGRNREVLRAAGNSVVPQVAAEILRAIKEVES